MAATLLTVALVLAGCNGLALGGDGTPERTLTPAAVPTDEPTPTPVQRLAPGLTGDGVFEAITLGDAHASVLDNTSYTMRENSTAVYSNGTVFNRGTVDAQIAANDSRYYVVLNRSGVVLGGGTLGRTTWSNGERVLVAETRNNSTSYQSPRGAEREPLSPREALFFDPTNREEIYAYFGAVETRVADRETRNGTRLYRIEATEVTYPAAFVVRWNNPRNLSMTALVDSRGLVHEYRLRYTATLDGETVEVTRRVRYSNLGNTTIERPPWYDAAIANATTPAERALGSPVQSSADSTVSTHSRVPSAVSGNILPGFSVSFGSSARLMARIVSTLPSPCSATMCSRLPRPMPCSPVEVPPISMARRTMASERSRPAAISVSSFGSTSAL